MSPISICWRIIQISQCARVCVCVCSFCKVCVCVCAVSVKMCVHTSHNCACVPLEVWEISMV